MQLKFNLNKVLFIDIETVPAVWKYDELDETTRQLWDEKSSYMQRDGSSAKEVYSKAGIFAEFGKIVCITVGYIPPAIDAPELRLKSFYGHDEKMILEDFAELLREHYNTEEHLLCAHNGKEFDFPWIARRMLVNNVALPYIIDIHGKKPWEVKHLDTMELWKFGDYKHFTSLKLLAHMFNIPTPKDDIQGSDVGRVYWEDKDLQRIVTYCQKDVLTVVQLLLKFKSLPLILPENVHAV